MTSKSFSHELLPQVRVGLRTKMGFPLAPGHPSFLQKQFHKLMAIGAGLI